MKIFGLIGGIGSGKSTVAEMFVRLGALRIDADRIGHEVLLFPEVKTALRRRWGDEVFDAEDRPIRRRIAEIVFGDSEMHRRELDFLKSLTHPLIGEEIRRRVQTLQDDGAETLLFDAPLLLESNWDRFVDQILFVDAPRSVRLERVLRRGWTEAEFDARENSQYSVEFKRQRADFVVDNAGFLDDTLDQVRKIWHNFSDVKIP